MTLLDAQALADHLVTSRLAGPVATPVRSCVDNARRLVDGDPGYTFGLSDWQDATFDEVVAALAACGVDLGALAEEPGPDGPEQTPFVDASVALEAIDRHRDVLARWAAGRARVLFATGHAFALLPHYGAIARALAGAGCTVLQPLAGERDPRLDLPDGRSTSIRYFDGVASLVVHGALQHTHSPEYMEAMLDAAGGPSQVDGVVGDHGYAGAAVEAGIETLSIADVNDPALPLAQARLRTDGVLVIDDGLNPTLYEPLTARMLSGFST
jgi:hypothetical protein